ncbi:MAG: M20 family metallo-hydrolase [Chloroflexi bacterium]|nr:MAG: M20 family metallo-hydrolase [Chloroflexota bacterium]
MSDFFRLQKHIDELSAIGAKDGAVTRLGLTAEEQAARDLVGAWCAVRGAEVRRDAAGNMFARFPGEREKDPIVLVGSHVDSVPEGGRFDGALGVICAVEAIESLLDVGTRFQRPVEVVAWADEEGARFGIGLFGSAAAFDRLPARVAERADRNAVSIADALRELGEQGDPALARRDPREIAAYLELHIEQGPRLAEANRPLGVVSDIVGIVHGRVTVKGRADHAGATVMTARADALKNVVPGECIFTIDVRAPEQPRIDAVMADFGDAVKRVSEARGLETSIDLFNAVPPTPLDLTMRDLFARAAASVGVEAPVLLSGAGHDAQNPALAGVPTGMLFIRSTGGSHTPRESAATVDAALASDALAFALRRLAG